MPIVLKFYWKLLGYFYRHCFPSDSLAQSEYLNCRINFFKYKEYIFRDLLNPYFWRRKCQKIQKNFKKFDFSLRRQKLLEF